MPVIKFDQPATLSDNTGSSKVFIEYLSKEDSWKGIEKEFFFNQENRYICDYEVIAAIDTNKKGLGVQDAKFYTGSINFSETELAFINNDIEGIKSYCISVMEEYAKNFNKGLASKDINWFAKLETNRYFKGDDPEVINGNHAQGDIKQGNNIHVHFIVGRKSKDNQYKLSPITNHQNTTTGPIQGGFSRNSFKEKCEYLFDQMFKYNRPFEESYHNLKLFKNGTYSDKESFLENKASLEVERLRYSQLEGGEKITRLDKLINYIKFGIDRDNPLILDNEKLLIREVQYECDGSIYQALMNLNVRMKSGYKPDSSTIMDTILKNAEYIHFKKSDDSLIGDDTSGQVPKLKFESNPEQSSQNNMTDEINNSFFQKHHDDNIAEYLRKRKKKLDRGRGNSSDR